ncbi:MAG: DivIVA domain-containing protein [Clostridia bacterium]
MLTLKEINDVSFRKSSFSGYKPEDVDDFIDSVTESFKTLIRENQAMSAKVSELAAKNADLMSKLKILAEKIESYRGDEDGIKNALLSAQKLSSTSIKEANAKAEEIVANANKKANGMIEEARKNTEELLVKYESKIKGKEKEFEEAKSQVTVFKASLFEMYKNHLNEIESIPDYYEGEEKRKIIESRQAQKTAAVAKPVPAKPVQTAESKTVAIDPKVLAQEVAKTQTKPTSDTIAMPKRRVREEESKQNKTEKRVLPAEVVAKTAFEAIDFDAYTDIPDVYKKDKEKLFDTLEFGEAVDIKNK